jgi:hypothetical protein
VYTAARKDVDSVKTQPKRGVLGTVTGVLLMIVCLAFWTLSVTQSTPAVQSSPAAQELSPAAYLPMILRSVTAPQARR